MWGKRDASFYTDRLCQPEIEVLLQQHTFKFPQQLYYQRLHATWEYNHAEQETKPDTLSLPLTHTPTPARRDPIFRGEMSVSSGFSPRHWNICQLMSHMATPLIGAGRLWRKWGAEIEDKKEERRYWHFGGQEAHWSPPSLSFKNQVAHARAWSAFSKLHSCIRFMCSRFTSVIKA